MGDGLEDGGGGGAKGRSLASYRKRGEVGITRRDRESNLI